MKFDVATGAAMVTFGTGYGTWYGQMNYPEGIGIGADGNIWVAEKGNKRFSVFKTDGSFEKVVTPVGTSWSDPQQVRFKDNVIWLLDNNSSTSLMKLYDVEGNYLGGYVDYGTGEGQAREVFGFDFDTRNGWALADYTNNRILAFSRCDSISTPTATMTPVVVPCGNRAQEWTIQEGIVGMASDGTNIFAVSNENSGIFEYSLSGVGLTTMADGMLTNPIGMAMGQDHRIYVVEGSGAARRVQVFEHDGTWIRTLDGTGSEPGTMIGPNSVAVGSDGRVYILDAEREAIYIYTHDGSYSGCIIKTTGILNGQWKNPRGIAVDEDGNIYLGDMNGRIDVLDNDGNYLRTWGSYGSAMGQFMKIWSLTFDSNGNLWVNEDGLDGGNARVQVFTKYGNWIGVYGKPISSDDIFERPLGLAFSTNGDFYISDATSAKLYRFESCSANNMKPTPTAIVTPGTYVLRLDVGAETDYFDNTQDNNIWLSDRSFDPSNFGYSVGGQAVTSTAPVTGTVDPILYQTYRYGSEVTYQCQLAPGQYEITLRFADFVGTAVGMNVFNVKAQDNAVLSDLDVYAAVGANTAYDRTFTAVVGHDGVLKIELLAVTGQVTLSAIQIKGSVPGLPLELYILKPGGACFTE